MARASLQNICKIPTHSRDKAGRKGMGVKNFMTIKSDLKGDLRGSVKNN